MLRFFAILFLLAVLLAGLSAAASPLVISEFLARNADGLLDEDGEHSDWIEIHNTTNVAVNIQGWFLTDDATDLTKWVFPSNSIPAGGFLVVFASDKNRSTLPFHTNFKMDGDGEYLALVQPDGETLANVFDPVFPEQFNDVSYGILVSGSTSNINLQASSWKATVPGSDIGNGWQLTGFDDDDWDSGSLGIGYDTGSSYDPWYDIDFQQEMRDGPNANRTAYLRVPFTIDQPGQVIALTLGMKYDDGFAAFINGTRVAGHNDPANLVYNSGATAQHADGEALVFQPFPIANPAALLQPGPNMLAIHGLNIGTGSSDFLIVPELEATVSASTDTQTFRYFATPSPGGPNNDSFFGFVADTTFSVDRGFYDAPFTVNIACPTPDAVLHYTLDGSDPLTSASAVSITPAPGATPQTGVLISSTTCLRAAASRTGFQSSNSDTQTYLFVGDIVNQDFNHAINTRGFPSSWNGTSADYGIDYDGQIAVADVKSALTNAPTLSIVTGVEEMFGSGGFYSNPAQNANVEVGCSTELIYPDGSEGFQINCAVKVQGGAFRSFGLTRKKSFRLTFSEPFGPTKLRYPVFGEGDGVQQEFDTLVLRMESNDGWQWNGAGTQPQYARDQFNRNMARAMGIPAGQGTYVHVYLNGEYWGIYNLVERPDNSFGAAYFGADKDLWQGINSGSAINGNPNDANGAWNTLRALAQAVADAPSEDEKTDALLHLQGLHPDGSNNSAQESFLHVDNYIDYLIVNYWADNSDWPRKNYYVGRDGAPGTEGFNFFAWDSEWSLFMRSSVTGNDLNDNRGVAEPLQDLRCSSEFRLRFADRAHRALFNGGPFYVDPANATWDPAHPERNRPAAMWTATTANHPNFLWAESARWGDQHRAGDPYDLGDWQTEWDRILNNWMPARSANFLGILRSENLYPAVDAPTFDQHGGTVLPGHLLAMTAPAGTLYYTLDGSDPRESRSGNPVGTPYSTAISLDRSATVKARVLDNGEWSALNEALFIVVRPPALAISEIMFHAYEPGPADGPSGAQANDYDFIELVNTTSETIGLPGYAFTAGIQFSFTDGAVDQLAPQERVVVVRNLERFKFRYPNGDALNIAGEYEGDLDDGGETITLENPALEQTLSLRYGDSRDFPLEADGAGHSLVPMMLSPLPEFEPLFDYGANWLASVYRGGSPGLAEPAPVEDLLINEFAAHTDTAAPGFDSDDWVELFNTSAQFRSLDGWYLSDDPEVLDKYDLSGKSVGPGDWLVVDEVLDGLNFGLSKAGERLYLSHLPGSGGGDRVADAVAYQGQENGVSLGRYPDGDPWWQTQPPSPGSANGQPLADVRIHEVMFHPAPSIAQPLDNTAQEYIVLHNPLPTTVALSNVDGDWRLRGEVDFDFEGITLPPDGYLALVNFNPTNLSARADFDAAYGLDGSLTLLGPYSGSLSNRRGRITLERPQAPEDPNLPRSWVVVDEMIYFDRDPWIDSGDGSGLSLHRLDPLAAGNDPANWRSGSPTPASAEAAWPTVVLDIQHLPDRSCRLAWFGFSGLNYTVEYNETLDPADWTAADTFTDPGAASWNDALPGTAGFRAYRIRVEE